MSGWEYTLHGRSYNLQSLLNTSLPGYRALSVRVPYLLTNNEQMYMCSTLYVVWAIGQNLDGG